MSISILRAEPSDAASTVDVGLRAFKDDPFSRLTMNLDTATPEQLAQWKEWRIGMSTRRMSGPGKHYFKAVDDVTGEVVGFTGMYAPEAFDMSSALQSPKPVPHFINHEMEGEFRAKQASVKARWLGERKEVWYVQSMAVSPEHWGRGIGKKLLKRGLEEVDKAGQDIYLEATPAAVAMYRSCGFEELERIEMCDGELVMSPMIRRQAVDASS